MSVLKIVILSSPLNILYIRRIFTTDENLRKKKRKNSQTSETSSKITNQQISQKKKKKNPAYNNNPNSQKINNSNARRGANLADIFTRIFFSPNTNAFQFQRDLKKFEEGEKKKKTPFDIVLFYPTSSRNAKITKESRYANYPRFLGRPSVNRLRVSLTTTIELSLIARRMHE